MARLILLILAICLVAVTVLIISSALRPVAQAASKDAPMSSQFRKIAFIALLILMMGVTTGLLGGL